MKIKILLALFLVQISYPVIADSYENMALQFIELTRINQTFKITSDAVQTNLDNYQVNLIQSSKIKNNEDAKRLTINFIKKAKDIAANAYSWDNVKKMYAKAVMDTYSEKELSEINKWLSSKYGELFIEGQHGFMLKTIDISSYSANQFKKEVAEIEGKFQKSLSNIKK